MRILHIVGAMNLGGQETFIMNVFRNINRDDFQFDFVVSNKEEGYFDKEIKSLGGEIYYIPPIHKNILKRCFALYRLIKKKNYIVVHRHSAFSIAFVDLLVAFVAGVKLRIIHSHADYDPHRLHPFLRCFVKSFSNYRFACSKQAGKWMYGNNCNNFEVIYNGIDLEKFKFNEKNRNQIRSKYGIDEGTILLGHTGRFIEEKNQSFLFVVLNKLLEANQRVKLCLLGDGKLRNKYKKECETLGISNNVIFCGTQDNVNEYLSAFDIFLFPSLHEGLGISLIEAEVNGLTCIVSDMINQEAIISNSVTILPLHYNDWVNEVEKHKGEIKHFVLKENETEKFSIQFTIKRLESIYAIAKKDKN